MKFTHFIMGWKKVYKKCQKDCGLKIGFWNKGGALQPLQEKINEIEYILKTNQFSIFGVVEANFFSNNNVEDIQISGFCVFWDKGRSNPQRNNASCVIFIREDLSYKLRLDLMDDNDNLLFG